MEYMALSLLIVVMILPLLYILTYRNIHGGSSSSRCRLPPSPPSLPVIGHLHLLSAMPHHSLTEIAERLRAPLLYLRLGRVPAVVISSPVLARAALTAHDAALSSRPSLLSARYLSFGPSDVSFSPTGPFHRQIRRIAVSELLSPRRVAAFGPVRLQEIRCLLSALAAASDGAAPLDLSARFFTLAGDVLCRVAFGRRLGSRGKRLPNVFAEALDLFAGFNIGEFFPEVEWAVSHVTGLRRRLERCLAELRAVGDEIIAEHVARARRPRDAAGEDEDEDEDEDFVDALLRVQRSPDLELPITDDNIIALVLDMLVAGIDSTSTTLEWVMTELARHPHIMRKAQEEVGRIVGDKGEVEESDIRQLHYIRAVIKESFRLHPPVPLLLPRESVEPCVLDGYDIPAKTRIVVNAYAIGRDPQTWSKPLEFDPERFDSGAEIDLRGQEFEMLPFGAGRRGCPGYSFALATIEAALASLLYHFDWELPPGVGAADVDMSEIFGLNTKKREPLFLVPKMRRPLSCN